MKRLTEIRADVAEIVEVFLVQSGTASVWHPLCAARSIGYQATIGNDEKTPDRELDESEREVGQDLDDLEREGDRMEERLEEAAGNETDAPDDEGESAGQVSI